MSIPTHAHQDLQTYERIVSQLRVTELQLILSHFKSPKLGKKQDLITRCLALLRSSQYQSSIINLIHEMGRRGDIRHMPYSYGPNSSTNHRNAGNYMNQFHNAGGTTMYNAQSTAGLVGGHTPRTVRNLRPVALPFYDVKNTVLEPVELPGVPHGKQTQRQNFTFSLHRSAYDELYRTENQPLPRLEIQMRFFYLSDGYERRELPDDFPIGCNVKIDDYPVTLPNIIPTNKPNAEQKRLSRPVDITQRCTLGRDGRERPHRVSIDWSGDRRVYAVAIYTVWHIHSDILRDRILSNETRKLVSSVTRQTIIRRLGSGDEDGITMDQLKISLLCPLAKTRMILPARCRECTHLQCFDLESYLKMNEKRPTWKCGVCSGEAPYNKLIIDEYFQAMLRDVSSSHNEVELLKDGGYRTITHEALTLSDDEDEVPAKVSTTKPSTDSLPPPKPKPEFDDSVIVLDSDSDDEPPPVKRPAPKTPTKQPEIVTLDDTPPRPALTLSRTNSSPTYSAPPSSSTSGSSSSAAPTPSSSSTAPISSAPTIVSITNVPPQLPVMTLGMIRPPPPPVPTAPASTAQPSSSIANGSVGLNGISSNPLIPSTSIFGQMPQMSISNSFPAYMSSWRPTDSAFGIGQGMMQPPNMGGNSANNTGLIGRSMPNYEAIQRQYFPTSPPTNLGQILHPPPQFRYPNN